MKIMFKVKLLLAIFLCLKISILHAEYLVTSLPVELKFDDDDYAQANPVAHGPIIDIDEGSLGAKHEWVQNGGWKGGAAKFFPPTTTEGYSGLRGFSRISENLGNKTQINVRFLAYHGRTLFTLGPIRYKLVIFNPNVGTRPMILTQESKFSKGSSIFSFYGACMSTDCSFHDTSYVDSDYSDPNRPASGSGFQFSAPEDSDNYLEQWVSIELEADTVAETITMIIHTQDGKVTTAQRTDFNDADFIEHVEGIPGYWGNHDSDGFPKVYDDDTYIMIDELVIDDERIGPPAGFITGPPQDAPTNLR